MRRRSITERAMAILEKIAADDQEEADLWHPDAKKDPAAARMGGHRLAGPKKPTPCPPGHVRNTKTGGCVPLRGAKTY